MIWLFGTLLSGAVGLILIGPFLPLATQRHKLWASLGLIGFIAASLGIYAANGAPELTRPGVLQPYQPAPTQPEPISEPPDINAMVAGLAARLADDPEDPEGWSRLIRSYIVLGDTPNLIDAHKAMSVTYADRPDIAAQISEQSGFNELAARLQNPE